jgi:hypothetical protein
MNVALDAAIRDIAQKLKSWDVLKSSYGIVDVFADTTGTQWYLLANPLKIERNVLANENGGIRSYDYGLNHDFGRLMGIQVTGRGYDTKPMWWHSDDYENPEDFQDGLASALRDIMQAAGLELEGDVECQTIVDPGYPWRGADEMFYSAKKKKWLKTTKPEWLIKVKDRDNKDAWAIDFCQIAQSFCSQSPAIIGQFMGGRGVIEYMTGISYFVTHATDTIHDKSAGRSSALAKCNGMLFPSLAVGPIPACNFGETVLFASASLPLLEMKPYKEGRGVWKTVTYDTDTWTETLGAFTSREDGQGGDIAIAAAEQLHGDTNWYYSNHIWLLGPKIKEEGFSDQPAKVLDTTSKLYAQLNRMASKWTSDMTFEEFDALAEGALASGNKAYDKYAYLETKANGIVTWDCFKLAAAPDFMVKDAAKVLRGHGYKGEVIPVPVDDVTRNALIKGDLKTEQRNYVMYRYSWSVRDAVLQHLQYDPAQRVAGHPAVFSVSK